MPAHEFISSATYLPSAAYEMHRSIEAKVVQFRDTYNGKHDEFILRGWTFHDFHPDDFAGDGTLSTLCLELEGQGEAPGLWNRVNIGWFGRDYLDSNASWFQETYEAFGNPDDVGNAWEAIWVAAIFKISVFGSARDRLAMGMAVRTMARAHQHLVAQILEICFCVDTRGRKRIGDVA